MRCVALTTTHPQEELKGSDLVIKDFAEVGIEKLEQLLMRDFESPSFRSQ
jgi:hypothetical protein